MDQPPATLATDRWRVAILGLDAWLIALVVPHLHVGLDGAWAVLGLLVPLPWLALGWIALGRSARWAEGLLLIAFPGTLALSAALGPAAGDAYGPVGMSLAALAWVAHLAAAAHAVGRRPRLREHRIEASASARGTTPRRRRVAVRHALQVVVVGGAFAVGVIAPSLGSHAELAEAWGERAGEGAVLAATAAAILAAAIVATVLGPGLRAQRTRVKPAERRRRVAAALTLAALAALSWLLLARAGA